MNIDERALVQRILRGDTNAFEEIVRAYSNKVYNTALRMCGNAHDAEDIAQDVFLRLYRSLGGFKGDSSLSTYIFRITSNLCIDAMRKNRGANVVSLYGVDSDGEEYVLELEDKAPSPLENLERSELKEAIKEAIEQLPEHSREIIVLREISGLSYRQIADATGAEEGTVKSRLVRARRMLCKLLAEKGNIPCELKSKYIETANSGKEVL